MILLRQKKFLLFLSIIAIAVVLTIIFFPALQKRSGFSIKVIDNHPSLSIDKNKEFSFDNFDQETKNFLVLNQVNVIEINFSDTPTPVTLSVHSLNGELIKYIGSNAELEDSKLNVDLFVSAEGLNKLNKSPEDLVLDSLKQFYFGLLSLEHQQSGRYIPSDKEKYQQQLNDNQTEAYYRAKSLIDKDIAIYDIKKN